MPLTEHEAQLKELRDALDYATEFTASDNEGRSVTARMQSDPHTVWDFTRPDGRRARVATCDKVQVTKLVRSIAMFGEWPSRMVRMPEFEEASET